jgi:DNA-binding protein Fis
MSLRDEARRSTHDFLSAFDDIELFNLSLYNTIIEEVERGLLEAVLARASYNQVWAADILGLARNTLRQKIKKLGLSHLTPSVLRVPIHKRHKNS